MTSTETTPATQDADTGEPRGWDKMDTLGLIAGVLLVAIVADILSDGRLISRRLRGQPKQAPAEPEVPVEP